LLIRYHRYQKVSKVEGKSRYQKYHRYQMYNQIVDGLKSYQKLIVWQRAKELVVIVYKITESFPKSEIYGLRSQMTRAAVSILSNIAEGYSRKSKKDKKRFLEMAIGSLFELESDIEVSKELGFLSTEDYGILENKKSEVGYLLNRYFQSF